MAAWTPPSFRYYRYPDGSITILDGGGNVVPVPPTMTYTGANGDSKVLDPWGNEVPVYVPTYPSEFFIHTFPDGTMTAVDAAGVPLPFQPEIQGLSADETQPPYTMLPDGTKFEPPVYEFPEKFFIHTFSDGSMMAIDAAGVPLSIQPTMQHSLGGDGPDFAVLPDGTSYVPPVYEFPEKFFIHTFSDGSMMAIDAAGVPLSIQPTMQHSLGGDGPDFAVLPNGTSYVPPVYEFPEKFYIHTAPDGSMMAIDAAGVPLSIQPTMQHSLGGDGPDFAVLPDGTSYVPPVYEFPEKFYIHTAPDGSTVAVDAAGVPLLTQPTLHYFGADDDRPPYMVLPDGTKYIPPPLYPPAGEPPEEWPPADWETSDDSVPTTADIEGDDEEVVEAAADQGPDSASADPADPTSAGDGVDENLRTPIDVLPTDEIATGGIDFAASADDARVGVEAAVEDSLDRDVSGLLTAGLVETPIGREEPRTPDAPALDDELVREALEVVPGQEMPVGDGVVSATPITLPGQEMPVGGDVVSATPITLPGQEMPVGGDVVSATPITLPGQEMPVGGDVVSATPITLPGQEMPVGGDVVSATPITLPGQEMPVGGDVVSVLPVPVPEPPAPGGAEPELDRAVDDEIALDRKGGDAPVDVGIDDVSPTDFEFTVEVVEDVHIEEVRLEDAEVESVEWVEPMDEPEDLALDDEDIDDLDS